jgi:hypothetical protein
MSVADFLADGIAAGQPTLIVATPEHRDRIAGELVTRKFDVTKLVAAGTVMMLDAQETLDKFMVDGKPDPAAFKEVLGAAIDRLCWFSGEAVVRAYGEMVDVLWRSGNCEGAIQLELFWNDLAKQYSFSLLCGYAMGPSMQKTGRAEVCAVHNHVHE